MGPDDRIFDPQPSGLRKLIRGKAGAVLAVVATAVVTGSPTALQQYEEYTVPAALRLAGSAARLSVWYCGASKEAQAQLGAAYRAELAKLGRDDIKMGFNPECVK